MTYLHEGAELVAESGRTYLAVSSVGQDNVWIGAEKGKDDHVVILKCPGPNDAPGVWPDFQQEMTMHELFKDCPTIREQVDRIPPNGSGSPPILVLEMIATTVWMARQKRPFARAEIVAIIKGLLESLRDVHSKGLVYSDIKMPNIMLDGFHNHNPSDGSDLSVKLGDLGEVMCPKIGTAQPIAYRAPEVYFKGEITTAADIWAVGLVLSHLLEAQTNFSENGLYNDLFHEDNTADQSEQVLCSAIANDYDLNNLEYYQDCALPYSKGAGHVNRWDELRDRLSAGDVAFLQEIMQADPRDRPTAASLLEHAWFKEGDAMTDAISKRNASLDDNKVGTQPIRTIVTEAKNVSRALQANSHAPIEFQSINRTSGHEGTVDLGAPESARAVNMDTAQPPQNASSSAYAPIEFQDFGHDVNHISTEARTLKSEAARHSTHIAEVAPQIALARAFSPIVFQDINNTTVPDDFSKEAAFKIEKAQKRLSARGVTSVQLNNQPLVDNKHKRESLQLQPLVVAATSAGSA